MLAIIVAGTLIGAGKIIAAIIAAIGLHKFGEWILPGNEAKLMAAMQKLKMKKGSAEAQFLKELTLTETAKAAREFRKEMSNDKVGTNNMLQAIMSQDTGFRNTIPTAGGTASRGENIPGISAPLPQRQLRGNREDVEGMQAAVSSLRAKTTDADHVPATLRLTGRPTHG